MIRDDVVALLAQRLNNRTDLNASIILEMQIAQSTRMEMNGKFQPWFLVTEYATEITDIGENRIQVPPDFINEIEESKMQILNPDTQKWIKLSKGDHDDLEEKWGTTSAMPQEYALMGDHFTFWPTPNQNYNIRMRYAGADTPLANNLENNWLKYAVDLMIAEVGSTIAATRMQNPVLAAAFEAEKGPAWARLLTMHEARMHTNREYTMGEEN